MWKLTLLYCALVASFTNAISNANNDWWKTTVIYQIYPRSFKDSNGDGIGDLNGITSKLEHLVDAGVGALWLSPIYSSPQLDFGYDIANFTDVNPEYGTLADFQKLTVKAKSLGLKVLLDFVPNHSSHKHPWFKKSVQKIKPYDEYYIWKDPKMVNGTRKPPNNWLSVFGGSAWEWNTQRRQYYLHQFVAGQPDLNYRCSTLRKEMENVLTFWLDRGVSGFRVDAINHLLEDPRYLDEPRSNNNVPSNDYEYLLHIYSIDQNDTYEVVTSWRNVLDAHSKAHKTNLNIILTETYTNITNTMKYYKAGSNVPFNFMFITDFNNASSAGDFKRGIYRWLNNIPKGCTANWVTGNHDNHRVASRYGPKREDQMSALAMILPGLAVIYNGDEIAMVDKWLSYKETVDPAGCRAGPDRYQLKSRDPERTPFQWDNTTSAGFSINNVTWLPVHENYKTLNLMNQKNTAISHFHVFQKLVALRKTKVLQKGTLAIIMVTEKVLGVVRRLEKYTPVVLLINTSNSSVTVDANTWLNIPEKMTVHTASVKSGITTGKMVDTTKLELPGAAMVVLGNGRKIVRHKMLNKFFM